MDIQEKKAFEIAFDKKLGARGCQFDLDEDGNYEDRETLCGWHMWLEAKLQAVPDGFVLVKMDDLELLRDSALEIKYASLNSDSDRIFSDIEDIQLSIERLIELQDLAND